MVFGTETENDMKKLTDDLESSKLRYQAELNTALQELQEIRLKIRQSQQEVNKHAMRNASITTHLQQVQAKLEQTSKADIRVAYDAALDALQRLFVMRGQLEKLQKQEEGLSKYVSLLQTVQRLLDEADTPKTSGRDTFTTVEKIIQGQEDERLKLSRQMHDGPAQALSNFILQTEIATRFFDVDQDKAREELRVLKTAATSTFQKVRDFIFELRPMMLDDLGLVPTFKRYADTLGQQSGIDIMVNATGKERRVEPYVEIVAFRALQELLRNAIHHSQSTEIRVQLDMTDSMVKVVVQDNGKGFDPAANKNPRKMGLSLIQEQVEMLQGHFEADSMLGQGARVSFQLPVSSVNEPAG